jgi:hypothetical protein
MAEPIAEKDEPVAKTKPRGTAELRVRHETRPHGFTVKSLHVEPPSRPLLRSASLLG